MSLIRLPPKHFETIQQIFDPGKAGFNGRPAYWISENGHRFHSNRDAAPCIGLFEAFDDDGNYDPYGVVRFALVLSKNHGHTPEKFASLRERHIAMCADWLDETLTVKKFAQKYGLR